MFAPQVVVNEVADGMDSGWNGNWCQEKIYKTWIWTGRNTNWNKEFDLGETFTNHLHCVQMMRCNSFLNEWIK
jgi:hypothetical protein